MSTTTFSGRVAVVTGAGRGVGHHVARKLAAEGAKIVVVDIDEAAGAESVAAIEAAGGEAVLLSGDVTEDGFAESLLESALEAFGDLHIVVNNAGYIWNGSALKHSDEQWEAMLAVHATAPFKVLRACGSYFREASRREGKAVCRKVVNVSSISGYYGAVLQFGYSTGKAALIGMTRSLAKEWGGYNVTVNCVALGYIDTRLNALYEREVPTVDIAGRSFPVGLDAGTRQLIEQLTPLGRFGTAEEAAGAISLLCRPESDFVSGQVLLVSGGLVY